ncbi:xenotropic and polytropic retrovirus receptor 1-like isoform X2 [Daktulosphaira vitifoliae]|uniref:xenotropic and polytropic retrovirus receptor 1-like isoform X2 n=1 Tax=Daktulosphaira vitifoliae TaxID=58002 RepID=UPI0021AA59C2|nr:xenotropic and polytropic retrovirus receptor 1-like isoform X2 [Daktulosphaira vitifoliae]
MKFAEHLQAHITPEWRKQYINYEDMKVMLYKAIEEAPSSESTDQESLFRRFTQFDEHFLQYCEKELAKINVFYSEKLAEAMRKFSTLKSELDILSSTATKMKDYSKKNGFTKPNLPQRKVQELKLAFSEFYLSLILLQNYQNLNYTGFKKILKKHDKLLNKESGAKWRQEHVEISHFYTNKDILRLINETEHTVTNELEFGDRQKAMKRLRVPPLGEKQSPWTTFKVGLYLGCLIVLFVAIFISATFENKTNLKQAFRLYRGSFLLIEFLFLIGINVYGWRSSGVNHVLIFELDPRNHVTEQHMFEIAGILGVVFALSILGYLYSEALSIPAYINPLSLITIFFLLTINPLKIFYFEARFWLLRILWRMISAPFYYVGFADFWLADQLNSLVVVLLDAHYLVCFYLYNENWYQSSEVKFNIEEYIVTKLIVGCIPAWIRFAQCLRRYRDTGETFPHLANAGKYSTTFFVVFSRALLKKYKNDYEDNYENPFFYTWVLCAMISSIYTYTWDVKMDWGLFSKHSGEYLFLREEIVYDNTLPRKFLLC